MKAEKEALFEEIKDMEKIHQIKYCIITNDDDPHTEETEIEAVGFYQWLNAFQGHIFKAGQIMSHLKDADFDIIHVRLTPENLPIIHSIRDRIGDRSKTKLVASMDVPVRFWKQHSYDLTKLTDAAQQADFVFATEYSIACRLEELVHKPVYELAYPADLNKIKSCWPEKSRESKSYINILYTGKINHFLWIRLLMKKYDIKPRVIFYKERNEKLAQKLSQNNIETVSCGNEQEFCKAMAEGAAFIAPYGYSNYGKWVIYAAAMGLIVVGNQLSDASRRCYPFIYSKKHSIRALKEATGLKEQSKGMLDFAAENALSKVEYYNWYNMRARFLQMLSGQTGDKRFLKHIHLFGEDHDRTVFYRDIPHMFGDKTINLEKNELAVVCLLKDGMDYLEDFLEHYNGLGVKHFVFIDDNSTDGTVEFLRGKANVTVYQTKLTPVMMYESEIRRAVIQSLFDNCWCLCVDVDELFDYPYSDRISLAQFLDYLNKNEYTAVIAYMLDMFSKNSRVLDTDYSDRLADKYCYYDISQVKKEKYFKHNLNFCNYNVLSDKRMKYYYGGIRRKLFGKLVINRKEIARYLLIKHPLTFIDRKIEPVTNPHFCNKAHVADVNCLLKHYKFTDAFISKLDAVRDYSFFGKMEHKEYMNLLRDKKNVDFYSDEAKKLENVEDLIKAGFLQVSSEYLGYIKKHGKEVFELWR
ncbi:MAG TPA: glycosyltransferase family 2 protein [Ruminiclostridium sp.]|nr:glycosyltransferase family 2 protein [Ruminiclostridium sp.]